MSREGKEEGGAKPTGRGKGFPGTQPAYTISSSLAWEQRTPRSDLPGSGHRDGDQEAHGAAPACRPPAA